ncbi:hypothetical protein MARCHEWKA_03500 [Brevundimonas phage vB_BpoS-Marchewka]|uniref:Uncharacterized protein n=1 Tax=Brevundimonas phage vB_BpoS-Marchewka TaxID=2948604 RepID=A0A9E7N5D8_9CAUD|nr:hypothetical protein MARCHEWKA_03500 [Brevundimonas phage vB_BpoS-Marchewka]UTC29308.1 hypothetical protein BAMBUS_02260 [Brevundimonas phage vB_BpoS-Bambus]
MTFESLGHETRTSDSSLYDEICIHCRGTDAAGDTRLQQVCPNSNIPTVKLRFQEMRDVLVEVPASEVEAFIDVLNRNSLTASAPATPPKGSRIVAQAYRVTGVDRMDHS